jgi:hypothetical protein
MTRISIAVFAICFALGCSTVTSSSSELVFEHFESDGHTLEITGIGPEAQRGVFEVIDLSYDDGTTETVVRLWEDGVATGDESPLYTDIDPGLMQQLEIVVNTRHERDYGTPFADDMDEGRLALIAQALFTIRARNRVDGRLGLDSTCVSDGNVWDCLADEAL